MKRVIFDIVLFIAIFVFPWWVSAFLLCIGVFIFKNFYEFIVACVIVYSLYSVPNGTWISNQAFFSALIIVLYIIIQIIKNNIILYKNEISH